MESTARRLFRRSRGSRKHAVEAHSTGHATHNRVPEPGKLEVTVWGTVDHDHGRSVALVLGEEDVRRLLSNLARFGF